MADPRPGGPPVETIARRAGRDPGIEAARFALCLAVIMLHVVGPPHAGWQAIAVAGCNAAVPFFFIASGYFNKAERSSSWSSIVRPTLRIVAIYAAWLAIYQLFFAVAAGRVALRPIDLITGGAAFHLWFLPALAMAQLLVGAGYRLGVPVPVLLLCVLLAVVAVTAGPIAHALGREALPGTRALAAPFYLVAGKLWARRGWVPPPAAALAAVVAFWLLAVVVAGGVMTYGLGLAVFGLVLSLRPGRTITALARLGRLSLGIYSVHLLLLWVVLPATDPTSLPQALARTALTLLAATLASLAIATLPGGWRLASYRRLRFGVAGR